MEVKVSELMVPEVVVAESAETVGEVREKMSAHSISAVPVVNKDGALLGIVTATDLVANFPPAIPVSRVMTTRVHTLSPGASVHAAARMMRDYRHHHIVVIEDERIVGILSSFDLLRLLEEGPGGTASAAAG